MSTPRPAAVSGSAITAIALGAVGILVVAVLIPGLKPVGALLGVAAIIVGGFGALNARRAGSSWVAPAVGASLGIVAVLVMGGFAIHYATL